MQVALKIHSLSNYLVRNRITILSKVLDFTNYLIFNSSLPGTTEIGKGTKLSKGGIAVVLHERCKIGQNCIIGSCVLVGGKSKVKGVPKIGSKVYIGSGAKILGDITIGNNVIIAPNSVVIDNIQSNVIVAGIPAKIKKEGIYMDDYV